MMGKKDEAVSAFTQDIKGLFTKHKITYLRGCGRFLSPSEVSVGTIKGQNTVVKSKQVIVATGSEVKALPGIAIDEKRIVSSSGALALTEIPKKLIVIGGGYVDLEIGSIWARLGSEVIVIEIAPDIVPSMDREIRKRFQHSLEKQGTKFKVNTKVAAVDTASDMVKLTLEPAAGGEVEHSVIEADLVLVSAGRTPCAAGIGLETIGVNTDEKGYVILHKGFSTIVTGVLLLVMWYQGPNYLAGLNWMPLPVSSTLQQILLYPYSFTLEGRWHQLTVEMKAHYLIGTSDHFLSYEDCWYAWLAP